jgi:hypothetical protein
VVAASSRGQLACIALDLALAPLLTLGLEPAVSVLAQLELAMITAKISETR